MPKVIVPMSTLAELRSLLSHLDPHFLDKLNAEEKEKLDQNSKEMIPRLNELIKHNRSL